MAMLDDILNQLRDYASQRGGGMPWDETPADRAAAAKAPPQSQPGVQPTTTYPTADQQYSQGRPTEIDYSQGVPMPYLGNKKTKKELMDADLQKFQEQNPVPPEQLPNMQQQPPIMGLLGPNIAQSQQAVPGNTAPAPAPPLPPPVNVPPPPQIAQAAAGGPPGAVPGAGPPGVAPPSGPGAPGASPGGAPTDVSAQSRMPQPAPGEPKGFLQRLDEMTQRNPALLLGLASGFAGAPSFGTGMSRGFAGAQQGLQVDQQNNQKTGSIRDTYRALVSAGVPPHIALAAAQNPEVMKQIAPDYLGSRKAEIKTIKSKDAFGNETEKIVLVNPYDGTVKDLSGGGGGTGGAGGAGTGLTGGTNSGMFAEGVTSQNFNHNAVGEDYLKQFAPEPQAAIKDYLSGNTAQTGRQMPIQMIKMAAQKYGSDIGMPADDTSLAQRKKWAMSLGDTTSGIGLQSKGFKQGLEHAVSLSDSLVKLGNTNGFGFEPLANWANAAKNLTSSQTAIKNHIQAESQTLAGEVGKLYSGGQGGGVHERQATQQNLGKSDQSPVAASGGLEATIELMEGGLRTLENRRDELFPNGNAPKGSQFRDASTDANMAKLRKNIAILKGEQQAEAGAGGGSGAGGTPSFPTSGVSPTLKVPWKLVTP